MHFKKKIPISLWKGSRFLWSYIHSTNIESPPCLGECACCGGKIGGSDLIHPQHTLMMKRKWTDDHTHKAGAVEARERPHRVAQRAAAWTDPQSRTHPEGRKRALEVRGWAEGRCFCKRPLFCCYNTCLHSSVLQGFEVKIAILPPEWEVYCPSNSVPIPIRMTPKSHMPPSPPCFCKIFLLAFLKVVISLFLRSIPTSCPLHTQHPPPPPLTSQPLPPWNAALTDNNKKHFPVTKLLFSIL